MPITTDQTASASRTQWPRPAALRFMMRMRDDMSFVRANAGRILIIAALLLMMLPLGSRTSTAEIGCSLVLALGLAALIAFDRDQFRLPNWLTYGLLTIGLVGLAPFTTWGLAERVLGGGLGYLTFVAVAEGYRRLKGRDGLGRGDAKLFAVAGVWTGPLGLAPVLGIASGAALMGVLWTFWRRGRQDTGWAARRLAFGPYLAFGLWIIWLLGPVS